jgi:hypothetical protein
MKSTIAIFLLAIAIGVHAEPVTLKNGMHVETGLAEAKLIAELTSLSRQRYLLIAGRHCTECDENTALYLGKVTKQGLPPHWSDVRNDYPGVSSDYETHELILRTKAYFGRCIANTGDQVIWFVDFPTDSGDSWTPGSEYQTNLDDGGPNTDITQRGQPDLENVMKQVKLGQCHEIAGIDMTSEP